MSERLERTIDLLDRYKWWLSGVVAVGAVVWADPADPGNAMTWVVFVLFLTLLWIPAVIRLARVLRSTAGAFKDGLNGR